MLRYWCDIICSFYYILILSLESKTDIGFSNFKFWKVFYDANLNYLFYYFIEQHYAATRHSIIFHSQVIHRQYSYTVSIADNDISVSEFFFFYMEVFQLFYIATCPTYFSKRSIYAIHVRIPSCSSTYFIFFLFWRIKPF